MSNEHGRATFVPDIPDRPGQSHQDSKKTPDSMLESLYWQNLGWVHTPPFTVVDLGSSRLKVPGSKETSSLSQPYFGKSFYPKLQIENKVPHGALPKNVAINIEQRKFKRQDLKKILLDMGLENDIIRPPKLTLRDISVFLKPKIEEGIPKEPYLDLELFDDEYLYEKRSPKEWMELGQSDGQQKSVPGTAFIPVGSDIDLRNVQFEWQKVSVMNCDEEKNSYLVRNEKDSNTDGDSDLWVKRIYLKFEAEEPFTFAKRLHAAVVTRHIFEESLRLCSYVENMPIDDGLPKWSEKDLNEIISVAKKSRQLKPKLQSMKKALKATVEELHVQYKKAVNYQIYVDVTGQNPNLITDFENEPLGDIQIPHKRGYLVYLEYPFRDRCENFSFVTLYNQVGVIRALNSVQSEILTLREMALFNLTSNDIASLDRFEKAQRAELQKMERYVQGHWPQAIADSITSNIASCDEMAYDTNQTVLHTFRLTKLGKLLKLVGFKMQDVIRFTVIENLKNYTRMFQEACVKLEDVDEDFEWTDSFMSNKWIPQHNPVFEVSLEIKGVNLEFLVALQKHRDTVVNLFDEGLRVTQNLPRLEKLVMKKLLYNPEDKLESVRVWEEQISTWKKSIISGMDRAAAIATAYVRYYKPTLEAIKEDQINYVKRLARSKTTCGQLRDIVEMHYTEKRRLEEAIPQFIDIGPFRLTTGMVRVAATRKHEQLADATLVYYHDRFRQNMQAIHDHFLVLLDQIDQGTGNIEDLLDKKVWCRTVPDKIERLSVDVNRMREDCKVMASFNRNMQDEDFSMYWKVQELPQRTFKKLEERMQNFDQERDLHKQNLVTDLRQLKVNLDNLSHQVALLRECWDISKASTTATDVRRIRKELTSNTEKANLYNKRERLFGQPLTHYPEIEQMAKDLVPYELFWLNAAEFAKYRERVVGEELVMEPSELKEKILEFRHSLESSLKHFVKESDPQIHNAVLTVIGEIDEFLQSKWIKAGQN